MANKPRLLIVDDEAVVRDSLREWFAEDGYPVFAVASAREALEKLAQEAIDVLLVDIRMPGMDGLELQRKVRVIAPRAAVVIMTAYGSVDTAVAALKEGAYDYIVKPFDPEELERVIEKAAEHAVLKCENERLKEHLELAVDSGAEEIIGESEAMQQVCELIATVAPTEATVLITGESGTGKELVARAVHRLSPRRSMPLVSVNCAGLPEGLIESELFGHEKGAFTGAQYRRKGKFELADGGTIFFDEIGDISAKTQIDLLRALEEKVVTRVGGNSPIPVDFRIVVATNRELKKDIAEGRFRLDLYYRFAVFVIHLPPLRHRRADIMPLADHFLAIATREMGRAARNFSPAARRVLVDYDWPGNVRELKNAVERAVVLQRGSQIEATDLPMNTSLFSEVATVADLSLAEVEKCHIQRVLSKMDGNITHAAQALHIDRVTLYNKIRKYGLRRNAD